MNASVNRAELGLRFQTPERNRFMPSLELRRRSNDHPMAMFSIAAGVAFLSMAFVPTTGGPAFASFGEPARVEEAAGSTEKTSRVPASDTEFACRDEQQDVGDDDVCVMTFAWGSSAEQRFRV
jgi:hypothetical protein